MLIQRTSSNATWTLEQANTRYILTESATIDVDEGEGIFSELNNSEILVFGDVLARDGADMGLSFEGVGSRLFIGRESHIDAWAAGFAVFVGNIGLTVKNRGLVEGGDFGIFGFGGYAVENWGIIRSAGTGIGFVEGGGNVVNHGDIDAIHGISGASSGTSIVNDTDGEIRGTEIAIGLYGDGGVTIVNKGTIRGGNAAIECEGEISLTNRGTIVGDVELGDGNDFIDTRHGKVDGVIRGGEGNDYYQISASNIEIEDNGASFQDIVSSTVSYRLSGGLDHLVFLGDQNTTGKGNSGRNTLQGNSGDNKLFGMDGLDNLVGNRGDDMLSGGAGADVFFFHKRHGNDTITDFEDGIDRFRSEYINTEEDFDKLTIRRHGDDLVINFPRGDTLTLLDTRKSEFDFNDFLTP